MRTRLWILCGLAACASVPNRPPAADLRSEVVRSATDRIGQRQLMLNGRLLPADCLALPRAAFGEQGLSGCGDGKRVGRRAGQGFVTSTLRCATQRQVRLHGGPPRGGRNLEELGVALEDGSRTPPEYEVAAASRQKSVAPELLR
jgi:hypothetical protein